MDKGRLQETEYLRDNQYKDSEFLAARARLHQRFSTANIDWNHWVFDHLELKAGDTVLECGCGPGWLWRANLTNLPESCQITLTDLSPGMVAEAASALGEVPHHFRFQTADIQELSFADASFDRVIANHMLYHVPDIARALGEVKRVLKPGGRFFAVTNGENHMRELKEMREDALHYIGLAKGDIPSVNLSFRLENGAAILAPFFSDVQLFHYEDGLLVTEVQPLVDYAFSSNEARGMLTIERLSRIRQFVADRMTASGGVLRITKAVGLFVAVKAA